MCKIGSGNMSIDLQNLTDSIRDQYLAWSDEIPFAEVVFDGTHVYDLIQYNFDLPTIVLRPESIIVDNLDDKVFRGLQQKEMLDFIQRLNNPPQNHQFKTTLSELRTTIGEVYDRMFVDIANPNFMILPRRLRGEYLKQVKFSGRKTDDVDVPSEMLETDTNEVFLIVKGGFKKIYPSKNRIKINTNATHGTNTRFEISIKHKVEIIDNDSFARITVT